jgi:hypothetical protein
MSKCYKKETQPTKSFTTAQQDQQRKIKNITIYLKEYNQDTSTAKAAKANMSGCSYTLSSYISTLSTPIK